MNLYVQGGCASASRYVDTKTNICTSMYLYIYRSMCQYIYTSKYLSIYTYKVDMYQITDTWIHKMNIYI